MIAHRLAAIVDASRRYAGSLMIVFVLLSLAGGYFTATHISMDTDLDTLISRDLPWRQREAALDRAFPQNDNIVAVVIDAKTPDPAADAAAALAARLSAMPQLFHDVRVPEGGTFFRQEGLLFFPTQDVQNFSDQIIAAQPLIGTLAADPTLRGVFSALDLLAQGVAQGAIDAKGVIAPLSAVSDAIQSTLTGRYAPLSWQTLLSGRTPDPQELRRFVLAQPVLDYGALLPGARAVDTIHDIARSLGLTPERGVRLGVTGPVALDDDQLATLAEGAGFTTALSLGLLCLLLLLALRSVRLVAAMIVTLIIGLVACATFAVGAVGALNPISVAFAVLFIGLSVDFGIQFSVRYRDERYRSGDLAEALRRTARGVGGPITVAALATSVGFFAFVPTDYVGVSELGKIAGVGMLLALMFNLTLLPALLALFRPAGEPHPVGFAWAAPFDHALVRRRRTVLAVVAIIAVGAATLIPLLRFDFNPLDLQNQQTEAMQLIKELNADPLNTPNTAEILIPSVDAAVALAGRLGRLPEVAQTVTAASFVPDDQPAKLAILSDTATLLGPTLSPPETKSAPTDAEILAAIATTAKDMVEAAKHGVPAAQHFAELLNQVTARGAGVLPLLADNLSAAVPRRLADLRDSLAAHPVTLATLPDEIKRDWITPDGRARIEVFPAGGAPDNEALRRFVRAVRTVTPDATGTPVTIQESADTVIHAFVVAGSIAVVTIAVLLLAVLRRAYDMAAVLAPLALAGLLTLATSAVIGLEINFANIIALPLLLGIGVAFDIYFVMRWRSGQGDLLQSSTARAVLFSALTTGTAFGSLAFSANPGMSEMGKLLSLALAYTLLCTLIVLPALLGPVPQSPPRAS